MRIVIQVLFSLFIGLHTDISTFGQSAPPPINIIFIIGDGMGLSQISSLYVDNTRTNFNRFKITGLVRTTSASHRITDSAAGATAYSTGEKTYNGAIGMSKDTLPLPTIFESLEKKGYNTGLVVTSAVTHATPASFYAHVKHRDLEEEIALQLIHAGIDYIAGGGSRFFTKRRDGLNLYDSLKTHKYNLHLNARENTDKGPQAYILAKTGMPKAGKRGNYLPDFAQKALTFFSTQDTPFYLLIEGSQIDWACHNNDVSYLLDEIRDFDKMLDVVLDFAEKHPNTLVLVTADHETGGFAITPKEEDYNDLQYSFISREHSIAMVPVFAFGPEAEQFSGMMENTDIYKKIAELLGIIQR